MTEPLLPPNSTAAEHALAQSVARLSDVPVPIRDLWNPATCPATFLPWLAWGLSIDFWDSAWTEAQKRAAIADAIEQQRRKGTPASLRAVLDRFDPMIAMVEWFDDPDTLDPHTFRLELPLAAESAVAYSDALILALLRDIAKVKPLRSHMQAVHALMAQANAWLLGAGQAAGLVRLDGAGDLDAATDPFWDNLLQTEDGEPILQESGAWLEVT